MGVRSESVFGRPALSKRRPLTRNNSGNGAPRPRPRADIPLSGPHSIHTFSRIFAPANPRVAPAGHHLMLEKSVWKDPSVICQKGPLKKAIRPVWPAAPVKFAPILRGHNEWAGCRDGEKVEQISGMA